MIRCLGFLLELFAVNAPDPVARLRARLTAAYHLLDPMMPSEGEYQSRWRLRVNVTPEEIESVVRTPLRKIT